MREFAVTDNAGSARADNRMRNAVAYAVLVACLAAIHFVLAANPLAARSAAQAAVFTWTSLGVIAGAGLFGLFFLNLTPLRGLWDRNLGFGAKIVRPAIAGIAIALASIVADRFTGWSRIVAHQMHLPSIHIAFPLSIPIYFGGAILVSIIYFFVLLPFLHWLIAGKWLKGRHEALVYWLIAVPLAFVEPVTQGDFQPVGGSLWIGAPIALCDVLLNLSQVWFLRRAGLIAAIALRVGYYAVWHVLYGLVTA